MPFPGFGEGLGKRFTWPCLVGEAETGWRLGFNVDVAVAGGKEQGSDGEELGMGGDVQPGTGVPDVVGVDEPQPVLPLADEGRVP